MNAELNLKLASSTLFPHLMAWVFVLGAAWKDWQERRIPDRWTGPFFVLGLLWGITFAPSWPWDSWLFAWGVGGFSYVFYRRGSLGGGDVKLLVVLGIWLPPTHFLESLLGSFLVACFAWILYALHPRNTPAEFVYPFAIAVFFGVCGRGCTLLFGL